MNRTVAASQLPATARIIVIIFEQRSVMTGGVNSTPPGMMRERAGGIFIR
jgi:hypothetical protein